MAFGWEGGANVCAMKRPQSFPVKVPNWSVPFPQFGPWHFPFSKMFSVLALWHFPLRASLFLPTNCWAVVVAERVFSFMDEIWWQSLAAEAAIFPRKLPGNFQLILAF